MTVETDEFKTEILELLDQAERALLHFDQLEPNASSPSTYDEVFRAYHNIKGAAGMMDWSALQHHVHQLENILMQSKESSSIPKHLIGWFLKGNDAARTIIDGGSPEFQYQTDAAPAAPEIVAAAPMALPDEFFAEVREAQ